MKNNTTKEYVIAKENSAVNTYTLSAEELAKYETPSKRENKPVDTACGKEVVNREKALPKVPKKEYTPKEYTTSDNDLFELGNRTGYNAMKSKYHKSASEDLNPSRNHAELDDFKGMSLLAICEYMASTELDDTISDEELYTIRRCCYDAVNHEAYRIKRDAKKHLYIESLIPDEDWELWELLKPYTTIQDRKILKYVAKGYTFETIANRLKCSKSTAFERVRKARAHAKKA